MSANCIYQIVYDESNFGADLTDWLISQIKSYRFEYLGNNKQKPILYPLVPKNFFSEFRDEILGAGR